MIYNDSIGAKGNIFKRNNEFIVVDTGHSAFYSIFKAKVWEFNKELLNTMAFEF